ncbi:MAG TPA: DUF6152 family protein [Steroidobacteraceae bacterium]
MNKWLFAMLGMSGLLMALPAAAHHSFAMFELTRSVQLKGTVKEVQWTNPHCFIQVLVPAPSGPAQWSIEMHSPLDMYRAGWRPRSFKPGDKVTVVINPLRDGTLGGRLVSAVTPDGRSLTDMRPQK